MKPATHRGTCQCCGALQKLPEGKLSQHGYEVARWGFFNGVCRGSKHLPFEQDYSLIESFIKYAQEQRAGVVARQEELRKPATEPKAWRHVYRSGSSIERAGYRWVLCEIILDENRYPYYIDPKPVNHRGQPVPTKSERLGYDCIYTDERDPDGLPIRTADPLPYATRENCKFAEALQKDIEELDRYIKWQQDRITKWKPGELKPVEDK